LSAKAQILQQSNQQKDSTSGSWNKLPFMGQEPTDKPIILIEEQNTAAEIKPRKKRKKKNLAAINQAEKDSLQKDSLVQAQLTQDSILAIQNSTATTEILEPSFFQGHALKPSDTEPIKTNIANPDWFTFILIFLVLAFTYIKYNYDRVFRQLISAFFNTNTSNQIIREENVMVQRASIILLLMFSAAAGLFLYQTSIYFDWQLLGIKKDFSRFLFFALLISVLFPFKVIILRLLGFIFHSNRLASAYLFNIFLINNVLGLLLIPLIILFAYLPFQTGGTLLYIGLIITALAFLYRLIKGYSIWRSADHFSLLYFILYLCTLEIAPILALLKYTKLGT